MREIIIISVVFCECRCIGGGWSVGGFIVNVGMEMEGGVWGDLFGVWYFGCIVRWV